MDIVEFLFKTIFEVIAWVIGALIKLIIALFLESLMRFSKEENRPL